MSVTAFYRMSILLPLLLPAVTAYAVHVLGLHTNHEAVQILLMSGVYGGLPYLVVAAYAAWWIGGRPEAAIRRRALQAPLLMIPSWLAFVAVLSVLNRQPELFFTLGALGIAYVLVLGYVYVGIVFLVRRLLRPFLAASSSQQGAALP